MLLKFKKLPLKWIHRLAKLFQMGKKVIIKLVSDFRVSLFCSIFTMKTAKTLHRHPAVSPRALHAHKRCLLPKKMQISASVRPMPAERGTNKNPIRLPSAHAKRAAYRRVPAASWFWSLGIWRTCPGMTCREGLDAKHHAGSNDSPQSQQTYRSLTKPNRPKWRAVNSKRIHEKLFLFQFFFSFLPL